MTIPVTRQIPAAVIVAVLLQAAAALLWAGKASARIDELEVRIALQAPVAERLAHLESETAAMRSQLDRIETKIAR